MQPIHAGLPNRGLYNGNAMRQVSVCLDSGMLATAACRRDARELERTSSPLVYPEDMPTESCTKHVSVEYCVTGGGVATEYCSKFPDAVIEARSLVKLNQEEVNEIKKAMYDGLYDIFFDDGFVYFVDEAGEPAPWRGFRNTLTENESCYKVCSQHTQASWEAYEQENGGFFGPGGENWGTDNDWANGGFNEGNNNNNGGNTGGNSGGFWG